MRAFAATAFGRDLGELDHPEGVRVLGHGDHAAATIRYRDLEIGAAPPAQLPPWIDREWLVTELRRTNYQPGGAPALPPVRTITMTTK
jgi:hypothetical protein